MIRLSFNNLMLFVFSCLLIVAPCSAQQTQTNPPNKQTKSPTEPVKIQPYLDKDAFRIGEGKVMPGQIFVYDQGKKAAFLPGGIDLRASGVPIPMRMLSMNMTGYSGTACAIYKNVLIDLSTLQGKSERLPIGYVVIDENTEQFLKIVVPGHQFAFIDQEYIIHPQHPPEKSSTASIRSITIEISSSEWHGKKLVPLPNISGSLKREQGQQIQFNTGHESKTQIVLHKATESVVLLAAKDSRGHTMEMPIPLPVLAAQENLLVQSVSVRFGKAPADE